MRENNRGSSLPDRRESLWTKLRVFNKRCEFEGMKYKIESLMANEDMS